MRPTNDDYDILQSMLADELRAEVEAEPFDPGIKKAPVARAPWEPLHNPTQRAMFRDTANVVGGCAEKGTGKSIGFGDKVIGHCYSEWDALFVIMGNSHRALAEGICHDLLTFNLPRWRDGNRHPLYIDGPGRTLIENPKAGELMDAGIGLEYTGWKADPNNKDLYLKIRNKFGGWSRIRVLAIPYGEMVQSRMTNLNASGFYLEEATRCDSKAYYDYPALQLGRRRGIKGPQQYLFSCNPDDPDHWVYPWMYKEVVVSEREPGRNWPNDPEKPGIRRDIDVSFYYVPYSENRHNIPKAYRDRIAKALKSNPVLKARLIDGKWKAMPKGDALFKGQFQEGVHIKGELEKKRGLLPAIGHPIVVGMDWGSRSVGIVFKQIIESDEGPYDISIDSISYYQEMHKSSQLARALLEKMRYWNEWLRDQKEWDAETAERDDLGRLRELPPSWSWWFITGDDATTNYNPGTGSINARDLQDRIAEILEAEPDRYLGIEAPIIRGCPRPKESISKRVDIMAEGLMSEMVVVSALTEDIRGMLFHLPRDKDNPSHPAKNNRWIHIFDGWSYPNYYRRFFLPNGFYNIEEGAAVSVA